MTAGVWSLVEAEFRRWKRLGTTEGSDSFSSKGRKRKKGPDIELTGFYGRKKLPCSETVAFPSVLEFNWQVLDCLAWPSAHYRRAQCHHCLSRETWHSLITMISWGERKMQWALKGGGGTEQGWQRKRIIHINCSALTLLSKVWRPMPWHRSMSVGITVKSHWFPCQWLPPFLPTMGAYGRGNKVLTCWSEKCWVLES